MAAAGGDISGRTSWLVRAFLLGAGVAAAFVARSALTRRPRNRVVGIIPARYRSSRFQGKPLALILGKPMIQRTWEQAKLAATLDAVIVATDDGRIAESCRIFGADVVMTSEECTNGTERCQEALQKLKKKYDIVVNIQGDEPLIDPDVIDGVVKALQEAPDAVFSTAVTSLQPEDAKNPNRVKCVIDRKGYAIYFSRGLIPFNKYDQVNPDFPYLLHLGIQCYDSKFLELYPLLSPTPLQLEEDLEQLKVLENGYKMKKLQLIVVLPNGCWGGLAKDCWRWCQTERRMCRKDDRGCKVIKVNHEAHGVDTPSDIGKIETFMRERNIL